jgi:hypothetical protein
MPRTFHVSLDARAAIDWPNHKLRGLIGDANGKRLGRDEARAELRRYVAAGRLFVPLAECSHFDPAQGCLGHPHVVRGET